MYKSDLRYSNKLCGAKELIVERFNLKVREWIKDLNEIKQIKWSTTCEFYLRPMRELCKGKEI